MFRKTRHAPSHGFALVAAIFLLVVLGLLAGFATYFVSVQSATLVLDVRGAQALSAANAGLEFSAWQLLRNSGNCTNSTLAAGTLSGTLAPYTVQLACTSESHTDDGNGNSITMYLLSATASAGSPGRDYVERRVTGTLTR